MQRQTFHDRRGMAFVVVLFLVICAVPVSLITYKLVNSGLKSAVHHSNRESAVELANKRIADYMHQFTNDPYLTISGDFSRPTIQDSRSKLVSTFTQDRTNNTVLIESVGNVGLDPTHPDARQRITALVQFKSEMTFIDYDFSDIDQFISKGVDSVVYEGKFLMNNGDFQAKTTFRIGPVISKHSITNRSMPGLPPGYTYFINGDLYCGGSMDLSGNAANNWKVRGTIYYFVPEIPTYYMNIDKYLALGGISFDDHTALWFLGDGTYRQSVPRPGETQNSLAYFLSSTGSNLDSRKPVAWSAPIPVPSPAVFSARGFNLGIKGTISPRVTVVTGGCKGCDTAGNIVILDSIDYHNLSGGTTAYSNSSASLCLFAQNRIWIKPFSDQNLNVSAALYNAKGTDGVGCGAMKSMNHFLVQGPQHRVFNFYGVRNALFVSCTGAYQDGFYQHMDSNLQIYQPPSLPSKPHLVSYTIK